jgi:hypothetical protein
MDAQPSQRQLELQVDLIDALARAVVAGRECDVTQQSAQSAYCEVAKVLVALRHEFRTGDGVTPDLKGRSAGYRRIVRLAYEQVGATDGGPIEKRLTASTSYWVRKLLVDRYGEDRLREIGVMPRRRRVTRRPVERLSDPQESLATAADILNMLVADLSFRPSRQTLCSVARAVTLLQQKRAGYRELGAA